MGKIQKYITAYFEDDGDLKKSLKYLKEKKVPIYDVFTPFPVHGLEKILGYRRSHLPKVGFIGGAIGAAAGLGFQSWVFTQAWPLNIGGKPYLSLPSFIPVTFECAILFSAVAMVFAFFFRSNLGLGAENKIFDPRATDDRFLIVLDIDGRNDLEIQQYQQYLGETGALGITVNQ
jgi:hypothetical protein